MIHGALELVFVMIFQILERKKTLTSGSKYGYLVQKIDLVFTVLEQNMFFLLYLGTIKMTLNFIPFPC